MTPEQVKNGAHIIQDLDANAQIADEMYKDNLLLEQSNKDATDVIGRQQSEIATCNGNLSACNIENQDLKKDIEQKKNKIQKKNLFIIGENIGIVLAILGIIFL